MRASIAVLAACLSVGCRAADKSPESGPPASPGIRPQGGAQDASPVVRAGAIPPRYLALGDSFTIGTGSPRDRSFPSRLVARYHDAGCAVELRNVAVNGYATDDVIDEELPEIASFRPTFVTVTVGANDIVRGRSLADYRTNVRRILSAARAGGARVVVVPQPDWSRSPAAAAFGTPASIDAAIRAFNAAIAEEAEAAGASYVDLTPLMAHQAEARELAPDGLHPSAAAYDAWAEAVARAVPPPCS